LVGEEIDDSGDLRGRYAVVTQSWETLAPISNYLYNANRMQQQQHSFSLHPQLGILAIPWKEDKFCLF
jgi:hypothetical protein